MNKIVNSVIKGTIIGSIMVATNEAVHFNVYPSRSATTKVACNIASSAVGFYVGRKVAGYCVDVIDGIISGYNGEV